MGEATEPRCPICKRPAQAREANRAFPFCSARCKQVELGKWLNEEYRLPAQEEDEGTEEGSAKRGPDS